MNQELIEVIKPLTGYCSEELKTKAAKDIINALVSYQCKRISVPEPIVKTVKHKLS